MIYTDTDVICCFPGIGRTTFSKDQNKEGSTFCLDLDYDGTNLKAFIDRAKSERAKKAHRYILVPMDAEILKSHIGEPADSVLAWQPLPDPYNPDHIR